MGVVRVKFGRRADARLPRAQQRGRMNGGAGDFLYPIDAIRICRDCVDTAVRLEGECMRQKEFDISSATALPAHRDRRFTA